MRSEDLEKFIEIFECAWAENFSAIETVWN